MITYEVKVYDNGTKSWWLNGQYHREDGPAVECANGYKEWWLNGKYLTEKEFIKRTSNTKELTVKEISDLLGYEVKIIKE